MSTHSSPRTRKPLFASLCVVALPGLTLFGAGCGQSEAATPRGGVVEAPVAAPQGGRSKIDEEVYSLEMKAAGTYKAGQEGVVEVTLASKGDYHLNDQYPLKFKVAEPAGDGVSYPKALLKREDGTFDDKKGVLKVPFIAAKKGKAKVAGVLSFSVCSEAHCVLQKQELEAVVDVQ